MVKEMTKKHLAAINRGRKAAGLKPIRMKKKSDKKITIAKKGSKAHQKALKSDFAICGICDKRIKKSNYAMHTSSHFPNHLKELEQKILDDKRKSR